MFPMLSTLFSYANIFFQKRLNDDSGYHWQKIHLPSNSWQCIPRFTYKIVHFVLKIDTLNSRLCLGSFSFHAKSFCSSLQPYFFAQRLMSLTPLLSNLAVSTTNTVNLMFNSTKMAEATN
jgi:hypothetical protein